MRDLEYQYKARRIFAVRPPLIGSTSNQWENYIARVQDERLDILRGIRGVRIRGSPNKIQSAMEKARAQVDLTLLTADIERATWNYKLRLAFEQGIVKYPPVAIPPPET